MAITYNPYGWKIRKSPKIMRELVSVKESKRDAIIEELQNYDKNVNHKSIAPIIEDLHKIQEEINLIWSVIESEGESGDLRPVYESMEYYSD